MENPSKTKTENRTETQFDSVRVRPQSKARFIKLLANANKKDFGSKITADDLFSVMLDRVSSEDIAKLQQNSLSNEDRYELLRKAYSKIVRPVSKDEFLGLSFTPAFQSFIGEHGKEILNPVFQKIEVTK